MNYQYFVLELNAVLHTGGALRGFREQGHMFIYVKGTRDVFGIYPGEQRTSYNQRELCQKHFREQCIN